MEGRSAAELASIGCFFASVVATCAMVARSGAFSAKTGASKDIGL
jgi:Na+-translocating ferredoxin:NAD+ oxidoreductase RnfE subunit